MTNAPSDLLAVRQYLIGPSTPLTGAEVGIVGDPSHASTGGYHEGNDDLARVGRLDSDYSKRESPRDRPGTNDASALDIGWWNGEAGRRRLSRLALNAALAAAWRRGDPRLRDVREIIYTPDGSTVQRLDRLGLRSTGDSSHLYHTHLSFFRDSAGRRAAPDNIMGLLREILDGEVATMLDGIDRAQVGNSEHYLQAIVGLTDQASNISDTVSNNLVRPNLLAVAVKRVDAGVTQLLAAANAETARDAATAASVAGLRAAVEALVAVVNAGGGSVDTAAILAGVADAVHGQVAPLQTEIADLRHRLAVSERAAADALDAPTS